MKPEQKPTMEEIYSDKVAHWFYGQIGSADIREDVLAAMKEWEQIRMKERDAAIKDLNGYCEYVKRIVAKGEFPMSYEAYK